MPVIPNNPTEPGPSPRVKLHPIIRAHLSRIGRLGGKARGNGKGNAFTSASGRAAVRARWARAKEAATRAEVLAKAHGGLTKVAPYK